MVFTKTLNRIFFGTGLLVSAVVAYVATAGNSKTPVKESLFLKSIDDQAQAAAIKTGIGFLIQAQFDNGGWGAGLSSRQDIMDPKNVQTDPATTAFCAMALVRTGSTLADGPYSKNVKDALEFLLNAVEKSPENSPNITTLTGTQIQVKLGQNIDVSMTSQFLTRTLDFTKDNPELNARVHAALQKCVNKIQSTQNANGSFAGGTWAPVLQSAMANNALELATREGAKVDEKALQKSRDYQAGNVVSATPPAKLSDVTVTSGSSATYSYSAAPMSIDAAGVELYSASGAYRANAVNSNEAQAMVKKAKASGQIKGEGKVTKENLKLAGLDDKKAEDLERSYNAAQQAEKRLQNETVISGFGNNGGEEFLSHMMTAESMVMGSEESFNDWKGKMFERIYKVQNGNGSWSGHHCITSPVFCTAAAVLMLSVENDKDYLVRKKEETGK